MNKKVEVNSSPTSPPALGDSELIYALRQGQASALTLIYQRFAPLVYTVAIRILQDPPEAEDLTQEVFIALWRTRNYDPGRGSLGSYLSTLTRSRAIDRIRAKGRKLRLIERCGQINLPEAIPSSLDQVSLQEGAERVRKALVELPQNQRQALELMYFDGFSQPEIARKLNVPLGTVKSWARLGLTKLRQGLQELIREVRE